MKTRFHSMIISLAALGAILAGPLPAASTKVPAAIYPVSKILLTEGSHRIQPGAADSTVEYCLGAPLYKPTKNMWVYHRFVADREEARERDCHNLLITFDRAHHVKSIQLINDEALAVLTRIAKTNPAALPDAVFVLKE